MNIKKLKLLFTCAVFAAGTVYGTKRKIDTSFDEHTGLGLYNCMDLIERANEKKFGIKNTSPLDYSLLHYAVYTNDIELAKYAIKRNCKINQKNKFDGSTPLVLACQLKNREIIKYLAKKKIGLNEANDYNCMPLYWACENNDLESVKYLIDNGADININTPLYWACKNDTLEIIKYLVKKGAKINKRTETFETALHTASATGNEKIVQLLIQNKAKINARNKSGIAPLHLAVIFGKIEIIKLLANHKAELDIKSYKGRTPLHFACEFNSFEIVQELIKRGASLDIKDEQGKLPIDLTTDDTVKRLFNHEPEKASIYNKLKKIFLGKWLFKYLDM